MSSHSHSSGCVRPIACLCVISRPICMVLHLICHNLYMICISIQKKAFQDFFFSSEVSCPRSPYCNLPSLSVLSHRRNRLFLGCKGDIHGGNLWKPLLYSGLKKYLDPSASFKHALMLLHWMISANTFMLELSSKPTSPLRDVLQWLLTSWYCSACVWMCEVLSSQVHTWAE